tara:strand:- start:184 stop:1017 length:834 start_codon:yes stop_codon:yes gene_type:complete
MQKYIHYKKWTGEITGHTREKSNRCIKVNIPKDNINNYLVFKGKLCKRDNVVRTQLEKELSIIRYGKKATVKLNIFPNEKILKIIIDKYFIQTFIDPYQFDCIEFLIPILKIYVHSKKASKLLGTLEIDLNEYIKTGKYEQNIATILYETDVTDLIFETHRSFETYAYEIFKESAIIDRNLIDLDYHIKIFRKGNQILIQNNINYWKELEDIKSYKFIISFFNKNRNYLEYYIPFALQQFESRNRIIIDVPSTVDLTNTKIHINSNRIKIKYEDTRN